MNPVLANHKSRPSPTTFPVFPPFSLNRTSTDSPYGRKGKGANFPFPGLWNHISSFIPAPCNSTLVSEHHLNPNFCVMLMYLPALAALFLSIPFAYGVDFYSPAERGGSMLDLSNGLGEPLNVIISGNSSPEILTRNGFHLYAYVVGFAIECFGQHQGARQKANLGDGRGWTDEIEVLREHFNIPALGTCLQSLAGGNHFRVWQQNGAEANSSAFFLAVSQEEDLSKQHKIVPNGYNIGRDKFVNQAVGTKSFFPKRYITTVQDLTNLLPAGSAGINHGIAQDGIVKLLTVQVKWVWQFW